MSFFDEEKNLVLIDFNNMLCRALAVNKELTHNGNVTGGIYGFVKMLAAVINFTTPKNIIVCDDKKPYLREAIYSKYKKDRVKNDDGFFDAFTFNKNKIKELLTLMNIPVFVEQGYEADDFIAYLTNRFSSKFSKTIIVSNDSDLLSLMDKKDTYIYKSGVKTKKAFLYGRKEFDADYYPVTPETFDLYTTMVGSHNGFPGIKGIGPVTAKKILSDTARFEKLKYDNKDHFEEAVKVLTLPYPGMVMEEMDSEILLKHISNQTKVEKLLILQGIQITSSMEQAFNHFR